MAMLKYFIFALFIAVVAPAVVQPPPTDLEECLYCKEVPLAETDLSTQTETTDSSAQTVTTDQSTTTDTTDHSTTTDTTDQSTTTVTTDQSTTTDTTDQSTTTDTTDQSTTPGTTDSPTTTGTTFPPTPGCVEPKHTCDLSNRNIFYFKGLKFKCPQGKKCSESKTDCEPCTDDPNNSGCPIDFKCNNNNGIVMGGKEIAKCPEYFSCNEPKDGNCSPCIRNVCTRKQHVCNKDGSDPEFKYFWYGKNKYECDKNTKCNHNYYEPCHVCIGELPQRYLYNAIRFLFK